MRLARDLACENVSLWRDALPLIGLGCIVYGVYLIDRILPDPD